MVVALIVYAIAIACIMSWLTLYLERYISRTCYGLDVHDSHTLRVLYNVFTGKLHIPLMFLIINHFIDLLLSNERNVLNYYNV